MIKVTDISLLPAEAVDDKKLLQGAAGSLHIAASRITGHSILRRSIDARGRQVRINMQLQVFIDEQPIDPPPFDPQLKNVRHAPHIVIIGAGQAGLFAALKLITLGVKHIVLERVKMCGGAGATWQPLIRKV